QGVPGVDLTWDGCSTDAGIQSISFDCQSGDTHELIGTFRLDGDLSSFVGLQGVIIVQPQGSFDAAPFWQFESGGCNHTGIEIATHRMPALGCSAAADPWPTGNGGI